jgi:hypothetical protein
MSESKLILEVLNGPIDGHIVTLEAETNWSKEGEGVLAFPWDTELGTPQARFYKEGNSWFIEGCQASHGTYHNMEPVETKVPLRQEDMLKASDTWLMVGKDKGDDA